MAAGECAAARDGVAVDAARERALAKALAHRLDRHAGEVLLGPYQRRGRDQAAQLIAGEESDVERRLRGHSRRRVMSRNGVSDGLGRPELAERVGGHGAVP